MPTWFSDPPDVLPAATANSTWHDVDISSHVGGADTVALAFFRVESSSTTYVSICMRKNGQTYDPYSASNRATGRVVNRSYVCGVDGSDLAEIIWSQKPDALYLLGYLTTDEAVCHSEPVERTCSTDGAYSTFTVSGSPSDCIGVCGNIEKTGTRQGFGLQDVKPNGATWDAALYADAYSSGGYAIGVDGSDQYQVKVETVGDWEFHETGYLKAASGFEGKTTPTELTVSSSEDDAWTTKTPGGLRASADAVVMGGTISSSSYELTHRPVGASLTDTNRPGGAAKNCQALVLDGSQQLQTYYGNNSRCSGWTLGDFAPTTTTTTTTTTTAAPGGDVEILHRVKCQDDGGLHPIWEGIA